jgi:hypothetical protein
LPLFYKGYRGGKNSVPAVPAKKYITLETTFFLHFDVLTTKTQKQPTPPLSYFNSPLKFIVDPTLKE